MMLPISPMLLKLGGWQNLLKLTYSIMLRYAFLFHQLSIDLLLVATIIQGVP